MALEGLLPEVQAAVGLNVPASEQAALADHIRGLYAVPRPLSPRAEEASDVVTGLSAGIVAGGVHLQQK